MTPRLDGALIGPAFCVPIVAWTDALQQSICWGLGLAIKCLPGRVTPCDDNSSDPGLPTKFAHLNRNGVTHEAGQFETV